MSPSAKTTTRPLNGELQLALATANEDIDAPKAFATKKGKQRFHQKPHRQRHRDSLRGADVPIGENHNPTFKW
jgi:hypothetical protein